MTDKDVQEYFASKEGKPVKEFIESDKQDAVVYSVTTNGNLRYIQCWSPVWKTIYIHITDKISLFSTEFQRGDIISIGKSADGRYYIRENKTASEIIKNGKKKILKDFNEAQQHNILVISEYQRARSHD